MIDKTLDIFLIVLFGAGGMTILLLAWIQPMSLSERILSTSIGAIGLFWMLLRTLQFRSLHAGNDAGPDTVNIEVEDKP